MSSQAGVVAAYYFEREDPSYPGAIEVTRAAFRKSAENLELGVSGLSLAELADRAIHASLGSIVFASLVTSLATSLSMLLRASQRTLRSKRLHPLLQPLTYLVPLFSMISSAIAAFNGFALSHTGITGETYIVSGRAVVTMLEENQTGTLAESKLMNLHGLDLRTHEGPT